MKKAENTYEYFRPTHRKGLEPLTTWFEAKCSIH